LTERGVCKVLAKDVLFSEDDHQDGINDITVDDDRIYSVGTDGALVVWEKANLSKIQRIPLSESGLLSIAIGANRIYIGGSYNEAYITVLSKDSLDVTNVLKEHASSILDMKLDDDLLVSGSADDEVILRNLPDMTFQGSVVVGNHIVQSLEIDSKHIYVGGIGDFVGVYRRSDLGLVTKLLGHEADIFSLAVDGRFVYSGSGEVWWGGPGSPRPPSFESAIRVWEQSDWECIAVLEGHEDNVNAILVDDDLVYSVSDDGTLRTYHKSDWSQAATRDLMTKALTAMTSDDEFLFIGSSSGKVCRIPK
jgi:WD40 repeat protein